MISPDRRRDAFRGPDRHVELDIGNAERDAPEARGVRLVAAHAVAPRADRLDMVVVLVPGAMQRVALAKRCFAEPGPRFLRVASNRGPGSAAHRFAKSYALRCVRGADHRLQGHRHQLRRPRPGGDHAGPPGRGRRDRLCAANGVHARHGLGLSVGTFMAINGDGFFSVQKASGTVDNVPVFTGVTDYTRRGDFQVNANGNLVNGAGYYLMGVRSTPRPATRSATCRRCCNSRTTSCRRRRPPSFNTGSTCRPRRSPRRAATAPAGTITAVGAERVDQRRRGHRL
jgi:hypothetical protein